MALPDFEESLRLVPDHSDALGGRALARIRLGEWQPAVVDAEAAVRLAKTMNPRTPDEHQAQTQALFNAARVYALAVEFADQEVNRRGERALVLYRKYRSRALDLLEEALRQVPEQDRRDEMQNDPALRWLRRRGSRNPGVRITGLSHEQSARAGAFREVVLRSAKRDAAFRPAPNPSIKADFDYSQLTTMSERPS
jgi:hypothetical protein